jgi:hypothetical protein
LTIEIHNNLFNNFFLILGGIWNLESGSFVIWGIPYANTYGIPRNSAEFREKSTIKIPRNSAKFRGIPCVFQKIPYSAGSEKSTSVDTLPVINKHHVIGTEQHVIGTEQHVIGTEQHVIGTQHHMKGTQQNVISRW